MHHYESNLKVKVNDAVLTKALPCLNFPYSVFEGHNVGVLDIK